jgi:hypothetical protein
MFDSRWGLWIILFTTVSRTALEPTQPPIQWVPVPLSLGLKWPVREADPWPPSLVEVPNAWSYSATPQYAFMAWRTGTTLPSYLSVMVLFAKGKVKVKFPQGLTTTRQNAWRYKSTNSRSRHEIEVSVSFKLRLTLLLGKIRDSPLDRKAFKINIVYVHRSNGPDTNGWWPRSACSIAGLPHSVSLV